MISGKSILAIIPARGGSKGIPRKNIRNLAGKPLIAWTTEEAKKSKYIDRLILSSEDIEIIAVAKKWGCEVPFVRPLELAQDDTPGIEPVLHALNTLESKYDYVMLLQPTSPLRQVEDIDTCIEKCVQVKAPACVSVSEVKHSPYWMYTLDEQMNMHPLIKDNSYFDRRQDLPPVYELNGAIYISEVQFIVAHKTFHTQHTIAYPMPIERSIDIDEEQDFILCELILNHLNQII